MQAFGFAGTAAKSDDQELNLAKARSLGNALLIFTTVPWFLCAVFYTGLHFTYPRDKARVIQSGFWRMDETEMAVETQQLTANLELSDYSKAPPR